MSNKCIVIGISGGIAVFKSAQLVSNLKKKGYDVHVIMSKNATEFVAPLTFETLSQNRVSIDTFDRNFEHDVHHISLAKKADAFVIVPATANVIAKVVHGIADDMLSTTFLAAQCPKIICPAMNTGMLDNPVTQANLLLCKQYGYELVESASGILACGDIGRGRLADLPDIEDAIEYALELEKPLLGQHVLITAGSTQEAIDPVRYIRNHSSGKMGFSLAKQAKALGAKVTLVSGVTQLRKPYGVNQASIISAAEMLDTCLQYAPDADIIIKAAAVGDFTPTQMSVHKIKKENHLSQLDLSSTKDILKVLCEQKLPHQFICGFAMESQNLIENAMKKLHKKNCDMIVANSIHEPNAGFQVDTNIATLVLKDQQIALPLMSKEALAREILLKILKEKSTCY